MTVRLQRLRRDLADEGPAPRWPRGYGPRAFTQADAAEVHSLLTIAYAGGGGEVGSFEAWWPGVCDDREYAPELVFLVADATGRIVAVAQCWTSSFIKDFVVHPDVRRLGLGEALLATVFAAFRDRDAAFVDLKVRIDNPSGAARLYRRLGMGDAPL